MLLGNTFKIQSIKSKQIKTGSSSLIPALCGNINADITTQALNQASCLDLEMWEKENIPYTIRKRRQAFFNQEKNPKSGEILCELDEVSTA